MNLIKKLQISTVNTKTKAKIIQKHDGEIRYFRQDNILFSSFHGRKKCSKNYCENFPVIPNNCVFHNQWLLPLGFKFCEHNCKGAFCTNDSHFTMFYLNYEYNK